MLLDTFQQVAGDSTSPSPPPRIIEEQKSSPKQVESPEAESIEEGRRGGREKERKAAKSPEQRPRRQRSRSRDRSPERDRDSSNRRRTHEYRHHRQYKGRGE